MYQDASFELSKLTIRHFFTFFAIKGDPFDLRGSKQVSFNLLHTTDETKNSSEISSENALQKQSARSPSSNFDCLASSYPIYTSVLPVLLSYLYSCPTCTPALPVLLPYLYSCPFPGCVPTCWEGVPGTPGQVPGRASWHWWGRTSTTSMPMVPHKYKINTSFNFTFCDVSPICGTLFDTF